MKQKASAREMHRQAMTALSLGRMAEGINLLRQLIAGGVENADLHNDLAAAYWRSGQLQGAEAHFQKAVLLDPKHMTALKNYVNFLKKGNRPQMAERALRAALKANPENAQLWMDLGLLHFQCGQVSDAVGYVQKSLALNPSSESGWALVLSWLEALSRLAEMEEALPLARAAFPNSADIALQEAKLCLRRGRVREGIELLERNESNLRPDSLYRYSYYFEFGKLLDRAGEYDRAYAAFLKANTIQSETAKVPEGDRKLAEQILRRLQQEPVPPTAGPAPEAKGGPGIYFLVGFPRSGTTLLDQILSSCKGITVAEEKPAVRQMLLTLKKIHARKGAQTAQEQLPDLGFVSSPDYPACIGALDTADIEELRDVFFKEHAKHCNISAANILIDKLPLNILHAGFIYRVFPEARFILALRHPCDTVLSCFMQDFRLNIMMSNFLSLPDAAKFYDNVFGIWEKLSNSLSFAVHTIHYEDVVADFRPTIVSLLEFLGVPWDDAVLEYDKNALKRDTIRTPSYSQVTEKLYTRASGRWLHYRAQLEPLFDLLRPHAEKYGYSLDDREA